MATLFTPNYKLDLYAEDDKPNLRDQYNAAMGKIDTELKTLADAAPTGDFAPKVHTSTQAQGATYGKAESGVFGHVKLADNITDSSPVYNSGTAASDWGVVNYAAPISHAINGTTYGIGDENAYGHLRVTDTIGTTYPTGTAVSPKGVADYVAAHAGGVGSWKLVRKAENQYSAETWAYSFTYGYEMYVNEQAKLMNIFFEIRSVEGSAQYPSYTLLDDMPYEPAFRQYKNIFTWKDGFIALAYRNRDLDLYFNNARKQALSWNFELYDSAMFMIA